MGLLHDISFASEEEELEGQVQAWNLTFAFASTMAVKAACALGIPDILAREGPGASLSLQEIASRLSSEAPDTDYLFRIMRFLCGKGVFSLSVADPSAGVTEFKYGLTPTSKWLVKEKNELSMTSMMLLETSKEAQASWYQFSDCVLEGGLAFEKAHGVDIWTFANKNPNFSNLVNDAMESNSEIVMKTILKHYHGFKKLDTLVDVGGGLGKALSCIVTEHPSIKGINYDLPHVVATAPSYPGVEHVSGDMFESVPSADAIFMKWIIHDWDDADSIKILTNCRKALPETGKVIVVEVILETDKQKDPFSDAVMALDLTMLAESTGGKERTEEQWKALLAAAGFPRYNIVSLPGCLHSVIEAFPAY